MSLVKWLDFNVIGDQRGELISLESCKTIPFDIKRVYYLINTKMDQARGFHAHRKLRQVAVCISGSCIMTLDDGFKREEVVLNSFSKGLLIEGIIWREMYNFSRDCVLMVIASEHYDEQDYIRNYEAFLREVRK